MYDFSNFGQRLQDLRKAKKLTQEDLAHKVGVSGQAVSKWENNQSYPDITLIPDLAQVLGTNISFLFGEQSNVPVSNVEFPPNYQSMPLISSTAHNACYSDKTVESKNGSGVKFTDGSTAELSTRIAVNKGPGSIFFLDRTDIDPGYMGEGIDTSITSKDFVFDHCRNVNMSIFSCKCKIITSPDNKTHVYAKGSPQFLHMLEVSNDVAAELLDIGYKQQDGDNNSHQDRNNELLVQLPVDVGGHAQLCINGSGEIVSEIKEFNSGNLKINGSGSIHMQELKTVCDATINGSGVIDGNAAQELNIGINGSGSIAWGSGQKVRININGSGNTALGSAQQLSTSINGSGDIAVGGLIGGDNGGDFSARISGSGNVEIGGGTCQKFDVDISGSGDINAKNVTANKAHIVLHQNGSVVLGRVIESSTEQIKKKGTITVINRGA